MTVRLSSHTQELTPSLIQWRRHLHANPELSFEEAETSRYIQERLTEWGISFTNPSDHSVVGVLEGNRPGPTVAIRADIDALPIQEQNEVEYASTRSGVMHACGHDAHTAILLGLANTFSRFRDFPGRVKFLFQSAEEMQPGGAIGIVRAGALDDVDHVLGLHVSSTRPLGYAYISTGNVTPNGDIFSCTIRGKGGHGALPSRTIDPLLVGAHVVTALQSIVSRRMPPMEPVVVSVCTFQAGKAPNVIPNEITFTGTVRTFGKDLQEAVITEMERIIAGACQGAGATYDFAYTKGYPSMVNYPAETEVMAAAAREVVGEERVLPMDLEMWAEDFSYYSQIKPSAYIRVGAGNEAKGLTVPHHHPLFNLDEDVLPIGLEILRRATLTLLGQ